MKIYISNIVKTFLKAQNLCVVCLMLCLSLLTACSAHTYGENSSREDSYYSYAKKLQSAGRFEAAKEYFLLALAGAKTYEEQQWLERELFTVDLQIKTLR